MKATISWVGGQLRPEETGCGQQDLVGSLQLTGLLAQLDQLRPLLGGKPVLSTGIHFGLHYPDAQGLRPDTQLASDPGDHGVIGGIGLLQVEDHAHGPLLQLSWVPLR